MTPINAAAKQWLTKLWAEYQLPPTSFNHWSMEYAREMAELATTFHRIDPDSVEPALRTCEVWDPDRSKQQWVSSLAQDSSVGSGRSSSRV